MSFSSKVAFCTLLTAAFCGISASADAQTVTPTVNCKDVVARPNVVYVAGSSALKPFLGSLAPLLAAQSPAYTIIYQSQGSCTGVNAIFNTDPLQNQLKDIPPNGPKAANYAVFFKTDGSTQECFLDQDGNGAAGTNWPNVDVGASDVFADSCGMSVPNGITIGDFHGPIQPMTFVVPSASTQKNISAEAAYMAFGLKGNGLPGIPWQDPSLFFVRNASSGTQQMLARAINVPAASWFGIDRGSSGNVDSLMKVILDAPTAEKSIGILSVDVADAERSNLRVLAFQAYGQNCAYLPDTSPNAHDKLNVRDGHYPVWGPVHLYARTSGGVPNAAGTAMLGQFSVPKLAQPLVDAIAGRGLVPECAMRVTRTEEMGPFASYQPQFGCGCYYDFKVNGATSCKACKAPADCPGSAPACNYGYCEVQ
jgi:ABC-type phosphate transport system substrate-binding protein